MKPGGGRHTDTASTTYVCSGMDLSPVVGQRLQKVMFSASARHKHLMFLLYERIGSSDSYAVRWTGHAVRVEYSGHQESSCRCRVAPARCPW
jgi:hypothetical protein